MNIHKLLFIFCLCFLLGKLAHGQVRSITLVAAQGQNSKLPKEILAQYNDVKAYVQATTGIKLKLKKFVVVKNPADKLFDDYYQDVDAFNRLKWWGSKRFNSNIVFFVTNPFREGFFGNYEYYMLGRGEVCGKYAYSTAQNWNDLGQYRSFHSTVAMAHELLHVLGANHLESNDINIMKPGTLFFLGDSKVMPRLDPITLAEIQKCQKRKGRR